MSLSTECRHGFDYSVGCFRDETLAGEAVSWAASNGVIFHMEIDEDRYRLRIDPGPMEYLHPTDPSHAAWDAALLRLKAMQERANRKV